MNKRWQLWLAFGGVLLSLHAGAQTLVGRGARDPLVPKEIVGSEGKGLFTGAGIPEGNKPVFAARDGAAPAGITPLPVDIFSTKDFYQDKQLWTDPRYYRCNSAVGLEFVKAEWPHHVERFF